MIEISAVANPSKEEKLLTVTIHVHSEISSGARPIHQIAGLAEKQNVQAVILTDHYYEKYEYGLRPLQNFLKYTFKRNSIETYGPRHYFQEIEKASKLHPDILMIDGTAVTPFYYWSGNLFPGPLILNSRGKDLLVLGLGNPENYQNLPVLGNKKSGFDAYSGDQFSAPYQKVIDHVRKKGGLVFWSHPLAQEHVELKDVFLGLDVFLDTASYSDAPLSTSNYHGIGIYSVELSQITNPEVPNLLSPGEVWDQVLHQYCLNNRKEPAWIIGETDYNGYPEGITQLDSILNMVTSDEFSSRGILEALGAGKLYLIIPASHTRRLILTDYSIEDSGSNQKAESGQTLPLKEIPVFRMSGHFSDRSTGEMDLFLIRNGEIIQQWEESVPFMIEHFDREAPAKGKNYYRVIGYSKNSPDRLATNPIFTER